MVKFSINQQLNITLQKVREASLRLHEITKVIQHATGVSATKPVSTEARFRLRMVKLLCLAKQADAYAVMSCRRGSFIGINSSGLRKDLADIVGYIRVRFIAYCTI